MANCACFVLTSYVVCHVKGRQFFHCVCEQVAEEDAAFESKVKPVQKIGFFLCA